MIQHRGWRAAVTKLFHQRLPYGIFAQGKQTLEAQKAVDLAVVTAFHVIMSAAIAARLVCLNKGLASLPVQLK
jgi:hypothetical protein